MIHTGRKIGNSSRRAVAAVLVATLALAACSQISHLTSARAVGDSFSKLGGQSGVSIRLSLGITAAQVSQLAKLSGGSGVSATEARAISQTAIVISIQTGNGEALKSAQAKKDGATKFDLALEVGSSTPVELRYVDQALYARAQIPQLLSAFGVDPSRGAKFEAAIQKGNQLVPGLSALGQGQWVSIPKSTLQPLLGLAKQFVSSQGAGVTATGANKLFSDLKTAFKNNATYANAGTHGGRTEYNVTVALRTFIQQAATAIRTDLANLPGGVGSRAASSIGSIVSNAPAQAQVQLWVKDNKAQEIDVDINQFAPAKDKAPFAVPLRIELGEPSAITAPSGATALDLSKFGQIVSGLLSGKSA